MFQTIRCPVPGAAILLILAVVGVLCGCSDEEDTISPYVNDLEADSLWCVEIGGWAVGPSGSEFV